MIKKIEKMLSLELERSSRQIEECDWSDKGFYADYMAQTFYYVRHSTRLLALAASRLNYEQEQNIHLRFLSHLREESNHERLAINDLNNLGYSLKDLPELNTTRLFYEPQYYKVEHEKPLALMGYILFLEALAQKVCPSLTKQIKHCHGLKTASFFQVHGEEDPEHVEEALKMIGMLSEENLGLIEMNFSQSAFAYSQIVNELKQKWKRAVYRKVA